MTKLPTIRSKTFSISVKVNGAPHKIFQIVFHSGTNSRNTYAMIGFPYFSDSKGLLSRLTFPANRKSSPSISLLPEGKITSHLVKYSHPLDGNTHFSGDGKIITTIRNQSRELNVSHGHMFTIQIQGIDKFTLREGAKKLDKNRIDLDFEFKDGIPDALKFVGWWFKVTELKGKVDASIPPNPKFGFREPDGSIKETGFVVSPPENHPLSEFVMLISCRPIPKIDQMREAVFSFIGGFDKVNDIRKDFHFLACIYPAKDFNKLSTILESIDFNPKNPLAKNKEN